MRLSILVLWMVGCAPRSKPPSVQTAPETPHETPTTPETLMPKANLILFTSASNRADDLRSLLVGGADIVARTEPGTSSWYALEGSDGQFGIFDTFRDASAQQAHFEGQVAEALQAQASDLVVGGWNGVLEGVRSFDLVAQTPRRPGAATQGMVIPLRAAPGQADALHDLLVQGASLVAAQEPGTLHWFALQDDADPDRLAIVDFFADDAGREAHFAGNVAAALEAAAPTLVVGGWQQGVLNGAMAFEVRAMTSPSE
ncbi:MAG: antibiotic biosynthesis monooxygenase family protein [Myxococcota bacterium]